MTRESTHPCAKRGRARRRMAAILVILVFLLFAGQSQSTRVTSQARGLPQTSALAATNWEVETVDSGTEVGVYASLALDGSGCPHIAYIDGGSDPDSVMDDSLSYAYRDAGGWHTQSVPLGLVEDEYAYGETSIAVDQEGYAHISFLLYDMYDDSPVTYGWFLAYAYQDDGGWHVDENVDRVSLVLHASLALDGGDPHIGYFSVDDYHLHYAHKDGGGWHPETADDEGGVGSYVSLALDSDANPSIAYARDKSSADDLKFAYEDGTGWYSDTVDSAGDVGKWASLALDGSGTAHVSYCDDTNTDDLALKYAYQDAGDWYKVTVDEAGSVGTYTSLGLDGRGYIHISYSDDGNQDLKYAYRDSTGWHIETVDEAGAVGKYTSLDVDRWGGVHIAYYDETNGALKYAHLPMHLVYIPLTMKQ